MFRTDLDLGLSDPSFPSNNIWARIFQQIQK